jgi:hypothetical protein
MCATGSSRVSGDGSIAMLNPHAVSRMDFARRLTREIVTFKGVRAVVIAGSVARGYADAYSDVEIPIFWETLPVDSTRHAIIVALRAEFVFAYDAASYEDQLLIDGRQVDLWHIALAHQQAILRAVLFEHRSDLSSLNAMDTVRSCVPLHGDEIVREWKALAEQYPEGLARKVIEEHLSSFSLGQLSLMAQRDNPTGFYAELTHLQQETFLILLALNRMYFPTFKWLYPALETMGVKPDSVGRRFRQAFRTGYPEAIAQTKSILEETVHLVEDHFPQIDVQPARRRLAYLRAAEEERPDP